MTTSYWITHPTCSAFISAFSPADVGEFLMMAAAWPVGRYAIREHRHGVAPPAAEDRPWGCAVKDPGAREGVTSE